MLTSLIWGLKYHKYYSSFTFIGISQGIFCKNLVEAEDNASQQRKVRL